MRLLLKGVERHLHSPLERMRTLGMIVGESLMNDLNQVQSANATEAPPKLKFEVLSKFLKVFENQLFSNLN